MARQLTPTGRAIDVLGVGPVVFLSIRCFTLGALPVVPLSRNQTVDHVLWRERDATRLTDGGAATVRMKAQRTRQAQPREREQNTEPDHVQDEDQEEPAKGGSASFLGEPCTTRGHREQDEKQNRTVH
jgi:hypothetical protein